MLIFWDGHFFTFGPAKFAKEALASLEIFQILVQQLMQKECVVVRSPQELLAYRPWAYYLVVLLSRGMLRDPGDKFRVAMI